MRKVEKIENLKPFTKLWTIRDGRVVLVTYLGQHPLMSSFYSIIICEGETLAEFSTEELLGYYIYYSERSESDIWAKDILPALVDWHYNQLEEIFALTELKTRNAEFPFGRKKSRQALEAQLKTIADDCSTYVDQLADLLECDREEVLQCSIPSAWSVENRRAKSAVQKAVQ